MSIQLSDKYMPSDDIVAREIENEIIIIPLTAGVGNMEDELYTFNESGRIIWNLLSGKFSLGQIAEQLSESYDAPLGEIQDDIIGIVQELLSRNILVKCVDN